jgi:pimeloyl-ACP methyl ester carboxylesterase
MHDHEIFRPNSKTVVLIHGFPEPIYTNNPLYRYFDKLGYTIIAPYLFSPGFRLTEEDVVRHIKSELKDRVPDVIAGVSMGGLVAPAVAQEYPEAKLILIGTGPYVKPHLKSMDTLMKIGRTRFFDLIYNAIEMVPTPLYAFFYKLFNHPKLTPSQKLQLNEHIVKNWTSIKSIAESEDREVIDFLATVNNTFLLKNLKNKTLIFAADADTLMPPALSRKLNRFVKGSKLVIGKNRIHYTVFDETDYPFLNNFLEHATQM